LKAPQEVVPAELNITTVDAATTLQELEEISHGNDKKR
jgi:hypothetical protein